MAASSSNTEESPSPGPDPEPAEPSAPAPSSDPTSSDPPASDTSAPEEPAPMIDIHPPHHPVHTWKDFLIHMSAICLGLLIAIGLEQSVEYLHHRYQAREARASIQQELTENVRILQRNLDNLAACQSELAKDMDVLGSDAPDAQTLHVLQYSWYLVRPHDAAWNAAKTNGSIALIAPSDIEGANYFYQSNDELLPGYISYFTDMESAEGIVDHARAAGKLNQPERDQLRTLTASAIGRARLFSLLLPAQMGALKNSKLD